MSDSGVCSLQEFHEGGEKDVMLEEIANLRDQLLEVLNGKIAVDQGLVPLTTPQVSLSLTLPYWTGIPYHTALTLWGGSRLTIFCWFIRKRLWHQSSPRQPVRASFYDSR
jgi:hypothetical protein